MQGYTRPPETQRICLEQRTVATPALGLIGRIATKKITIEKRLYHKGQYDNYNTLFVIWLLSKCYDSLWAHRTIVCVFVCERKWAASTGLRQRDISLEWRCSYICCQPAATVPLSCGSTIRAMNAPLVVTYLFGPFVVI